MGGVLIFIVAFVLVYRSQRRGGTFFDDVNNSLLCGRCYEPSSPNTDNLCECGGRLDPYEYYRWEEPEIENNPALAADPG